MHKMWFSLEDCNKKAFHLKHILKTNRKCCIFKQQETKMSLALGPVINQLYTCLRVIQPYFEFLFKSVIFETTNHKTRMSSDQQSTFFFFFKHCH